MRSRLLTKHLSPDDRKVAGLHVQVVRLQIAELRRQRVDPVIRKHDGLCILELRKDAWRER